MDAKQDGALEVNGNVRFRVTEHGPKWPEQCVVCGETCIETREFDSTAEKKIGNRLYWTAKGAHSFKVPVHATTRDCYRKLKHPMPLWGQAAWVLGGLLGGAFMGAIARPDWKDRIGAFVIFGSIALLIARIIVGAAFPRGLIIHDLGALGYVASFNDEIHAQRFAELNKDAVEPWHRSPWNISINLFPWRKKLN